MPKKRKGDMYSALLQLVGRPPKPSTKLKKPPRPKSGMSGGGGGSGGGISKPKGGGGSKSKGKGLGKAMKSLMGKKGKAKGPSQKETNEAGVKETPKGLKISPEEINESPADRRARMRREGREAGREGADSNEERNAAAEGTAKPPASAVSNAGSPQTPDGMIDIPPDNEEPYARRARMRSEGRRAERDRRDRDAGEPETSPAEDNIPRARDRKRGSRERQSEFDRADVSPDRPAPPVSTEQELDMVQTQLSTPRPEDIEILMANPQKYIGPFIEAFGEASIPPEVWSALESPTGAGPGAFPYPPGGAPPIPPEPPMGTYPPATMIPPARQPAMPPLPPEEDPVFDPRTLMP